MAERDSSRRPNGTDETGITDAQYKGMLLDALSDWQELAALAARNNDAEVLAKAERQMALINEKLRF